MKYKEVKEFLKNVFEKRMQFKEHAPAILLVGSTATSKSALVREVGEEMKVPVVQIRTALTEPADLTGIPRPDATGTETVWLKPDWFPYSQEQWDALGEEVKKQAVAIVNNTRKNGPNGIIFFDEANRGPLETLQAVFQILSDYKVHCHVLPKGYIIVGAINPGSLYQTTDVDQAFWTRWVQIKMDFDEHQALAYAVEQGYDEKFIQFLAASPHLLTIKESFDLETFHNWRGWNFLGELAKLKCIPEGSETEIAAGCVGKEGAAAWMRFNDKSYKRPIPGTGILSEYSKYKKEIKDTPMDSLIFTINEIIAYANSSRMKPSYINNLIEFVKDIKSEARIVLVKQLNSNIIAKMGQDPELKDKINEDLKSIGR